MAQADTTVALWAAAVGPRSAACADRCLLQLFTRTHSSTDYRSAQLWVPRRGGGA